MYVTYHILHTCHTLPPSEIGLGLFWANIYFCHILPHSKIGSGLFCFCHILPPSEIGFAQEGDTYFAELAERVDYDRPTRY